ncbi:MAG: ABC transporter ATP-binding protein [Planctomycetota bacterium]
MSERADEGPLPAPGEGHCGSFPRSSVDFGPAATAAIEVRSLSFAIEDRSILHDVHFAVAAGEHVAIVGPNGAGKTTLVKCLDGLVSGWQGEISVLGRPLQDYPRRELARRIGYVPQADSRAWPFTVEQFVLMGRYPYFSPFRAIAAEDREAVHDALERTGTASFARRLMGTLSSGERQKVLIAAALAQGAEILLLDEPTTFLDYRHQAEIRRLLRATNRDRGVTIVAVTHDVSAAALDADRVLALCGGRVAFHGLPGELMNTTTLRAVFNTELLLVPHPRAAAAVIVPDTPGDDHRCPSAHKAKGTPGEGHL